MSKSVRCSRCGKAVSRETDGELVVRAYVECPECVESKPDAQADEIARLRNNLEVVRREKRELRRQLAGFQALERMDLKGLLSELEGALVTERGWEMEDGTANRVMDCFLLNRTTLPVNFFSRWLNTHAEARGVLATMGVKWGEENAAVDS